MLRDFVFFLRALWREWRVLLTGGSIAAILALLSFGGVRSIPQKGNWLIIGVTFILAAFLAWRNERINPALNKRDVSTEAPPEERIVIDVAPEYLVGFYKDHTDVQADKLAESYIGKWIKQSGKVANVTSSVMMKRWDVYFAAEYIVSMAFDQAWADRISVLKRGEQISVLGQIKRFNGSSVHLEHCELLG